MEAYAMDSGVTALRMREVGLHARLWELKVNPGNLKHLPSKPHLLLHALGLFTPPAWASHSDSGHCSIATVF